MKREILGRLAALETCAAPARRLDESDPRVIAYRNRPSELAAVLAEIDNCTSPTDDLSPQDQVGFWSKKVAEAEFLISTGGRDKFDDLREIEMDERTMRILRSLTLEIAQDDINNYRAALAKAQLAVEKENGR